MSHMTSVMYFLFLQKVDPALLFASRLSITISFSVCMCRNLKLSS